MKKYLFIFMSALLLASCTDYVRTSTPQKDAAKLRKVVKAAKTPRELDEAQNLIYRYQAAYEEEIYDGKRSAEDLKYLMLHIFE